MSVIGIVSISIVSLLVIGFLIGVWRGWAKSLARLIILLCSLVISLFTAPAISSAVISKYTDGTVLSVGSLRVDFKEVVEQVLNNQQMADDLLSANSTTTELARSVCEVAVNIVLFFAMFILLLLFSLIVYWIVCAILRSNKKKKNELSPKKAVNRLVGGALGFLSMMVISFALLTPVFGVMNICDKFIESEASSENANAISQTASAATVNEFLCGKLYYTEDEKIGNIETYAEKYENIRSDYNSSALGTVFNALGISKLGEFSFNYLTTTSSQNLKLNLTDEFVSIIRTYNLYKKTFVENEFDIANNDSVDGLIAIYGQAEKSEIVKSYLIEFVPKFIERWSVGEAFLGIDCPVTGEYNKVFIDVLQTLKSDDIQRISNNINALLGTLKVANDNELIVKIRDEKVELTSYLETNETLVKDVVLKLTSTTELKNNLPVVMNDVIEMLYHQMIDETVSFEENKLTNDEINEIVWTDEAETLQLITNKILNIYSSTSGETDSSVMIDYLSDFGEIIDLARDSKMLSKPLGKFLVGFVNSDAFVLENSIKLKLSDYLDTKWSESSYKFKDMFAAIEETARVADNISKDLQNISINDLKDAISLIVDNQDVKDTVKDLVIDSGIIDQLLPNNPDEAEILTDMLGSFIENTTSGSIAKDIEAGQKIIDIVSDARANDGNIVLGTTEEEKQAKAAEIVESLASSDAIMAMLETANSTEGEETSAIKDAISNLGGDASYIRQQIELSEISAENKAVLAGIFGTNN